MRLGKRASNGVDMNNIVNEIKNKMEEVLKDALPEVKAQDLEADGAIFYMNGNNGTSFDWHVNQKLSTFMMFYKEKPNLGVIKCMVFSNGDADIYVYGDHGNEMIKQISCRFEYPQMDLLKLAVSFKWNADEKFIWDANIDSIDISEPITDQQVEQFLEEASLFEASIKRRELMSQYGVVSTKVLVDGWNVGYMVREQATRTQDSGWSFYAGNESDEELQDTNKIRLIPLGQLCQLDPAIFSYIDAPVGSTLLRISEDTFEQDDQSKPIFFTKWSAE